MPTSPPPETCPACGAPLTGRYCPECGQRAGTLVFSVGTLLRDVLEDQFSLNSALPRTLRSLFFRPGFLTSEYLRQRISPYIAPFRLYLGASVLFFLALAMQATPGELAPADLAALDSIRGVVRDSTAARAARGEAAPGVVGIHIDPTRPDWAEAAQVELGSDRLNRAIRARLLELGSLPPDEALGRLFRGVIEQVPKVMFLLLPLYALLLKLLYFRSGRYYVEHFIFALHVHAFAFGVFLLMLASQWAPVLPGLLGLWLMAYSWLALKRVYGQGWVKTTLKWLVLGNSYLVAVGFGLGVAILAAVLTV